jgi:hypothetical protein
MTIFNISVPEHKVEPYIYCHRCDKAADLKVQEMTAVFSCPDHGWLATVNHRAIIK